MVVDELKHSELGVPRTGWQSLASTHKEKVFFRQSISGNLSDPQRALLRVTEWTTCRTPIHLLPNFASLWLSRHSRSRVLLLRRLWRPLPLSSRTCRCGRPLDPCGHHRAVCSRARVLGRRGFALENAAARVCREAGARVSLNVLVRDLDLHPFEQLDGRRLEVVADGLPLFHGAQLAIDTTMVSTLRGDGSVSPDRERRNGAALAQARRRKERSYTELCQRFARARLVVLATEVGRRWSEDSMHFLHQLARAKVRNEPRVLKHAAKISWLRRWGTILACSSLLEQRSDTLTLSHSVPPKKKLLPDFLHPCIELLELTSEQLDFLSACHFHSISPGKNNSLRYHAQMRCAQRVTRALFL